MHFLVYIQNTVNSSKEFILLKNSKIFAFCAKTVYNPTFFGKKVQKFSTWLVQIIAGK